jgi:Protein of unknown function (DUF2384)
MQRERTRYAALEGGLNARDVTFIDMLRVFRRSGGIAREEDLFERRAHGAVPIRARANDAATFICFEWDGKLWLPWFQFDRETLDLLPGPASVINELAPVFDGWEMASWFAQPNLWLGNARPIDLLDASLSPVLGAARADRFVAGG